MGLSSVYKLLFMADDRGSLSKMRNVLKGVGETSYTTFNAISRNMSKMEKSTSRLISRMSMLAGGGGLMLGIYKSLNYSIIQSNSLITTNRILLEEIIGSKGKAREMVNVVQEIAGSFGADINEMMTASRGLSQVMRQIDKGFQPQHLERMLKLVNVVSNLDTENRGLSYTTFSFKEALQGLGGGDWRSMRNRLEINLGKTYEKAITKAVKGGNMDEVVRLFEEAFKNIGINAGDIMGRLMSEGLIQNIHRFSSYVSRTFQMLGEKSFSELTKPLSRLNFFISEQFKKDTGFMKTIEGLSQKFSDQFLKPISEGFNQFAEAIYPVREEISGNFLKHLIALGKVFTSLIALPFTFVKGLLGMQEGLVDAEGTVYNYNERFKDMEKFSTKLATNFKELKEPVNSFANAVNNLIVALLKLSNIDKGASVGSSGLTSLIKNGLKLAEGGTNIVADGVNIADKGVNAMGMDSAMGVMSGISLLMMLKGMRSPKIPKGISTASTSVTATAEMNMAKRFGDTKSNKNIWNDPENSNGYNTSLGLQSKINANKNISNYNKTAYSQEELKKLQEVGKMRGNLTKRYGSVNNIQAKQFKVQKDIELLEQRKASILNSPTGTPDQQIKALNKIDLDLKNLNKKQSKLSKDFEDFNYSTRVLGTNPDKNMPDLHRPLGIYDSVPSKQKSKEMNINLNKPNSPSMWNLNNFATVGMALASFGQLGGMIKNNITTKFAGLGAKIGTAVLKLGTLGFGLSAFIVALASWTRHVEQESINFGKKLQETLANDLKAFRVDNAVAQDYNKEGINVVAMRNLLTDKHMDKDLLRDLLSLEIGNNRGVKENSLSRNILMIEKTLGKVTSMGGNAGDYSKRQFGGFDLTQGGYGKLIETLNLSFQADAKQLTPEKWEAVRKQLVRKIQSKFGKSHSKVTIGSDEAFTQVGSSTGKSGIK